MQIETKCDCVVTTTPYMLYFARVRPSCNTVIKLCDEHKTLLREELKLQLDRMYSDKTIEIESFIRESSI